MATYLHSEQTRRHAPPPRAHQHTSDTQAEILTVTWLGLGTYTILILLAAVYFLERTAFVDISFHLFSLITSGTWAIQNFRFGALFTQAIPLLGIHLGWSLHTLALLYSLVFPFLYATIFLVVVRRFRQPRLGLLLLGYHILMVTDTFYWIQSELSQGMTFLVLYVAALFYLDRHPEQMGRPIWSMVHPVILFMLVFFHPLLLFGYGFLWLYFWQARTIDRRLLHMSGGAFVIMYGIKHLFFKTAYDTQSMEGMQNIIRFFPHYGDIPTQAAFVQDLISDYSFLLAGLVILLVWGVYNRQWWTILLTVGSFAGYALLVNCSYPDGTVKFYRENLHLPLTLFVLAPLIFQVLPKRPPRPLWIGIALVCAIRLIHIQQAHGPYTARLDWMRGFMREHPEQKLIVDDHLLPMDTLLMTWATPYEFWLLSTLDSGQSASVLLTDQPQDFEWAISQPDHFIAKWGVFPYENLPPRYFQFQEGSPYQLINGVMRGMEDQADGIR